MTMNTLEYYFNVVERILKTYYVYLIVQCALSLSADCIHTHCLMLPAVCEYKTTKSTHDHTIYH